jgi:glycosyltransferase involved in cell wall biosynthesis
MTLAGRVDIPHVQTPFVARFVDVAFVRRSGLPTIETYHTFFEAYLHHYLPLLSAAVAGAIARGFSRQWCNAVDAAVALSLRLAGVLCRYGVTRPVHTIPTGLDLEQFSDGDWQLSGHPGHRTRARGDAPRRARRARGQLRRIPRSWDRRLSAVGAGGGPWLVKLLTI